MALGAATQHIVTDTEETAKTLIEYLRKNRFGRATFLPVAAMKGRTLDEKERRVLSMPGCLGDRQRAVRLSRALPRRDRKRCWGAR